MRRAFVPAALAAFALAAPASPAAHEIPRHVTVQVLAKAEGDRLHVLVRAPLGAMRDIQFPERGDGLLDIARAAPALDEAAARWIVPSLEIFEEGARLGPPAVAATRVSLPSDRSFLTFDGARAHVTAGTLPAGTDLPWPQALIDVLLEYRIASEQSRFSIRPGFARLGIDVVTSLRAVHLRRGSGGQATPVVRGFEFRGDPGLVPLNPRWHQAAWRFTTAGFFHILDGIDHLLFLLCLVLPFRRLGPLLIVVTAFTAAHSVALAAAALRLVPEALWFPPLVEMLIAASIVFMAIENIAASPTLRRRGVLAFVFGLVHGFGFSFALTEGLQFAGAHLLTSLFAFNLGVEIGQVLVLIVLVPALTLLFRLGVRERIGTIVVSALVAHTAWHWMADRWSALRSFTMPSLDATAAVMGVRVLIALVIVGGVAWWVRGYVAGVGAVDGGDVGGVGTSPTSPPPHDPH
ncbi:MAG TPA: HupE/UreJ family protein [Vicinamibacterales bacterium]